MSDIRHRDANGANNEAGGYCSGRSKRQTTESGSFVRLRQHAREEKEHQKGTKEGIKRASERKSGKAPEWAPPRLSHIFPWVLCASLPHFSGGTLCESPTFFRGTCGRKACVWPATSSISTPHCVPRYPPIATTAGSQTCPSGSSASSKGCWDSSGGQRSRRVLSGQEGIVPFHSLIYNSCLELPGS